VLTLQNSILDPQKEVQFHVCMFSYTTQLKLMLTIFPEMLEFAEGFVHINLTKLSSVFITPHL
jgi:hypothetical protein